MPEQFRLAELVAALSLGTDLGMGQPLEQAVRTCLISLALGERLGLSAADRSTVYYTALLRFLGCTADAHEWARFTGGDDIAIRAAIGPVLAGGPREFGPAVFPLLGAGQGRLHRAGHIAAMVTTGKRRARAGMVAHCEVAENLSARLGLSDDVRRALTSAFEQWNGAGLPNGTAGEAIPPAARIVFLARDVELLYRIGGRDGVAEALRARRGRAYDPAVVDAFLAAPDQMLAGALTDSPWEDILDAEPAPRPWIPDGRVDDVLSAIADFVDLKSPYTAGHSRAVADLAAAALPEEAVRLRRAGLVHDLGRVAVPNSIWDKRGPLSDGEWERVRLHAYYTERIVGRVGALADLATLAGMHHERLDGSGYHRGTHAEPPLPARVLAAADAFQAMTQPRPHRAALTGDQAAEQLDAMARARRLDDDAVQAILTAAGHHRTPRRKKWPGNMTDREIEILRLICRGLTKNQVADRLTISARTVDHHIRHIYQKAGVRTRAGITLFALEHDLLP